MSCVGDQCGTGGGNIPKPGDPSNNGVLSATPAFGGIDVTWAFPTTNPFAVAYTVVYRAVVNSFDSAIVHAPQVGGGFFFDRCEPPTQYYYWIQFVSINGTYGEVIGPVSAVARSSIEKTIEDLTGKIDAGVLANDLKAEIARIGDINSDLLKEAQDRALADANLGVGVGQVQDIADLAITAVVEETNARNNANAAMVDSINLVYAQAGAATAAIQEEAILRASADEALAQQITTVQSTLSDDIAQVQTNMETKITAVDGKVTSIGALYTAKVNVNGLIGGFGVYNDGTTVDAGFDVDTFWIGRTGENKKKPFIVVGDEVLINQAVINELSVTKITSGEVNAEWRMTGTNGRIVVNNGAYMKVLGIGFGVNSDLIEWFGPSMGIASCSKANAVSYLSTSGDAYFGGSLSAGTLRTAVTNPTFGAAENVITGPFGSNGNAITVVGSINMYSQESSYNYNFSAGAGNTSCAFTLYRTLAGGSETAVHSFFLPGNISYDNYTSPDDLSSGTISLNGSFTFVDPVKSTLPRTYRLATAITYQEFSYTKKIAAPPVMDIGGSYDQRLTIVTTE